MKKSRLALGIAALSLVATPAHAASNPKTEPTQAMWCPEDPGKLARIWVEPGKRWTADNQCAHGTWLSISWGMNGSSDSTSETVLVAPKTRFGPRKSGSLPQKGGWWGASLSTRPEFCEGSSETYVVWPNSKGVFDPVC